MLLQLMAFNSAKMVIAEPGCLAGDWSGLYPVVDSSRLKKASAKTARIISPMSRDMNEKDQMLVDAF